MLLIPILHKILSSVIRDSVPIKVRQILICRLSICSLFILTCSSISFSQSIELRLENNPNCEKTSFCSKLQVKSKSGHESILGTSSIYISFDKQVVNFLSYQSLNFDENSTCSNNDSEPLWYPHAFTEDTDNGLLLIGLVLNPDRSTSGCPSITDQTWIDIGQICFEILSTDASPNIEFITSFTPIGKSITHVNSFSSNDGTNSLVLSSLTGILGSVYNCPSVSIEGHIDLQARILDTADLNIHFYDPSSYSSPVYEVKTQTDESGNFILSDIPTGTYDVCIKHPQSLQRVQRVSINDGINPIDFNELRMGDASNDNQIDIIDFATLLSTYNKNHSHPSYKYIADFNADQLVNIIDFSILLSNYNQSGEIPGRTTNRLAKQAHSDVSTTVKMYARLDTLIDNTSDSLSILLYADSYKQSIDGIESFLSFDPQALEVLNIIIPDITDIELLNQYDNQRGTIDIALGFMNEAIYGNFSFAQIIFRKKSTLHPDIQFDQSISRNPNITYQGQSVLSEAFTDFDPQILNIPNHTQRFQIYPNPSSGTFSIAFQDVEFPIKVEVFDIQGRNIYSQYFLEKIELAQNKISIKKRGLYNCLINNGSVLFHENILIR